LTKLALFYMTMQIIIFLTLIILIYYGLHSLLFWLLIKFFFIEKFNDRLILAIILFALSVCFILGSLIAHFDGGITAKAVYYLGSVWIGVVVNLILFLGLGFIFIKLLILFGVNVNLRIIGAILLFLTTLYTTYGIIHAQDIKIKNISVAVKNLPTAWQGKKIVQISDVHLGIINTGKLMEKIVDKALAANPDYVFITGDLLDGTGDNLSNSLASLNKIRVPIFMVTGNHETYLGIDKTKEAINNTNIKILHDDIVNIDGMQIIGADYPERMARKDFAPLFAKMDKAKPNILLYHEPLYIDKIKNSGIILELCGHTHRGQMYPILFFTNLIYKGYEYGLHNFGDYNLYTTSGAGTWGPPMRIGSDSEIAIIELKNK